MASKKKNKIRFQKNMIGLTLSTIFCAFVSVLFFKIQLSSVNIEVEKLKKNITKEEKINESLTMKVNELVSLENMQLVAASNGLEYNNNNIIVIKK